MLKPMEINDCTCQLHLNMTNLITDL